jgi:hypothetical protein
MAKQTFTTGQVLTAAQMTSLQQTAMGGGSTTAKTISYTLVAADAGTVVQMNSASATTITVNTALFVAGDTVQIQNIGAGVCTVTAGTATVDTSATLALKQYDAGTLYFNSASAAIFFAVDAADGMTNPMTTAGDIIYRDGSAPVRLGIGTAGQVLTVNSGATAPEWAAASAGGKVLQVVNAITTTATTIATTAMTDTTITATITPTLATSKILILINGHVFHSISSAGTIIGGQLMRGASVIQGYGSSAIDGFTATGATATNRYARISIIYMDSPATTSATTYKLQGRINDTANSGTSTWQSSSFGSSIVLMEIGV